MPYNRVKVSRGYLVVCDECHGFLKKENWLTGDTSKNDDVIHELCPNCTDYNQPLIDDLLGSGE
ncbi:MAG TPA: hypothetical protein VIU33_06585 [Nitrospiria bacterium]